MTMTDPELTKIAITAAICFVLGLTFPNRLWWHSTPRTVVDCGGNRLEAAKLSPDEHEFWATISVVYNTRTGVWKLTLPYATNAK